MFLTDQDKSEDDRGDHDGVEGEGTHGDVEQATGRKGKGSTKG